MKSIKSTLLLLLLLGPVAATIAHADHGHYRGGGGFRGGHLGVFIDPWPLFYPFSYYPYGYAPYAAYPYAAYPPVVVTQPAAPTVYMEQSDTQQSNAPAPSQSAAPSNDWYYCHKPEGYYPYVRNCADGWQRVPAQPSTQH